APAPVTAPAPAAADRPVPVPESVPEPAPAPAPAPAPHDRGTYGEAPRNDAPHDDGTYDRGMRVRREVLGDDHVDRAEAARDDFTGDFEDFVTRYAWGGTWARPGLDRRTRSIVTLTALTAGGHLDELALHTRAALRGGLTPEDVKETLLHTAVYCGVPAVNAAFAVARRVIEEEARDRA
ncbi:4-carboxymuconolactone decarboxylase, partial [Streptomyces sp. ISL-11]|uniref:4-carboxymuconolactone decarboxylase n=1 Tax=Streptomyces sp. ISL-11 TaxID=2819174 RepID=UPI001BEC6E94